MPQQPYRTKLAGWGRYPVVEGLEWKSEQLAAISKNATLSRGLGRSYGDSSLPAGADCPVVTTTLADRLLSFDPVSGRLRAEAGATLFQLNRVFLRQGWFVPVSPGTQFVTLGGMIASDVHGKNHHVDGCLGEHVNSIQSAWPTGGLWIAPRVGAGLVPRHHWRNGVDRPHPGSRITMRRIPSPWIWGESERIDNLNAMVAGLKEAAQHWPMTVGWVDCLARAAKRARHSDERSVGRAGGSSPDAAADQARFPSPLYGPTSSCAGRASRLLILPTTGNTCSDPAPGSFIPMPFCIPWTPWTIGT